MASFKRFWLHKLCNWVMRLSVVFSLIDVLRGAGI